MHLSYGPMSNSKILVGLGHYLEKRGFGGMGGAFKPSFRHSVHACKARSFTPTFFSGTWLSGDELLEARSGFEPLTEILQDLRLAPWLPRLISCLGGTNRCLRRSILPHAGVAGVCFCVVSFSTCPVLLTQHMSGRMF